LSYHGLLSNSLETKIGVPQGSVLGPVLFAIYINDIDYLELRGKNVLYADDICLVYTCSNVDALISDMQSDLIVVNQYISAKKFLINVGKSKHIIFSSIQRHITTNQVISLNGQPIERVQTYRYLGLNIDCHLNWQSHVELIVQKINPIVRILYRLRDDVTVKTCMLIYYSLIESHFNYMANIWGTCAQNVINKLEVLQNRALKIYGNCQHSPPPLNYMKLPTFYPSNC